MNYVFIFLYCTGCPNKHGELSDDVNIVFNNNSLIQYGVIPSKKAVIRKIFIFYVYNLFVYVLTVYGCTCKTRENCNNCLSSLFILQTAETLQSHLTVVINKRQHTIILQLVKSGISMLILNKDDLEFITEFPCLLGHPVDDLKLV